MDRPISLLRQLNVAATLALAICLVCGCSLKQKTIPNRELLVGQWRLQIGSSCSSQGITKDELILHSDGRLEQHSNYDDKRYDVVDQHWNILTERSVSLDKWLDITDNPTGKPTFAVLSIEVTQPPLMLINPDSNCFYVKAGAQDTP